MPATSKQKVKIPKAIQRATIAALMLCTPLIEIEASTKATIRAVIPPPSNQSRSFTETCQCVPVPTEVAGLIFALSSPILPPMSRYDRPSHRVFMTFFYRQGWQVQWYSSLEADLKTPLPRNVHFHRSGEDPRTCATWRSLENV
jgi:hypothetical protein